MAARAIARQPCGPSTTASPTIRLLTCQWCADNAPYGAIGEVFKARDTRLDRSVAIKISAQRFSEYCFFTLRAQPDETEQML